MERQISKEAQWNETNQVYEVPLAAISDKKRFLCSCGASKQMPFCDGTHASLGFKPVQIQVVGQTVEVRPRQEVEIEKLLNEKKVGFQKRSLLSLGTFAIGLLVGTALVKL